jgi:asparagine synthase (glutamine-hydrolysing)
VEYLKQTAREPGSNVNQTFEDDLLMIVLTFGIFLDTFQLPSLN